MFQAGNALLDNHARFFFALRQRLNVLMMVVVVFALITSWACPPTPTALNAFRIACTCTESFP